MNQDQGPGTISRMGEERGARKCYEHELIKSGWSTTSRTGNFIESTHLQSLDLASAFHKITIKDAKHKVEQKCKHCGLVQCKCPAFTRATLCSLPLSTPPHSDTDKDNIPELVLNTSGAHILYPPQLSPSDEEADKEVAQICKAPVYYRLWSLTSHRCRYYTYNSLDTIDIWLYLRFCPPSSEEAVQLSEH